MAALLSFSLGGCDRDASPFDHMQGLWQSQGYGMLALIEDDDIQLIERTAISCLPIATLSVTAFLREYDVERSPGGTTFEVGSDGTLSTITFERPRDNASDHHCPARLTPKTSDPELNFEVLWHTFNEHYAFFSERNVDWDAVYAEFRPLVTKATRKEELRKIFVAMLERLGDGHVGLEINGEDWINVDTDLDRQLANECRQRGLTCRLDGFREKQIDISSNVFKTIYLNNDFKTAFDGDVLWGRIGASTGYFRIDSMADLASRDHASSADDVAALGFVLDEILSDLGQLPQMIVDVRLNGGGHDLVAVTIASRFADREHLFGSKLAFERGERMAAQDLVVKPADARRYKGRIAVLTSGETASAAEVFALAMRALPDVSLVGETTMGIFSDEFYRSLPNGWQVSLSNEIYLSPSGELFEAIGVPPDVSSPFMLLEDHQHSLDGGIDAAIAALANSN